ncbi:saccharopine dehydrogenase NADP-binding domain-containing protein [Myxococcus sp. SDU36]|uniref:saccharopine dehydrogenase NADP-binding domain-containing protein n=1 Tax=Myxococcus sp. SDU36 TaxID=2831967 RepID=UPI002542B43B|nr:saccharopine dehydrogenase NADP-binding domain-containing protein [Myxococcus sp. SDU36]WIG98441.1 saccharopine dehydrogenase NADP-binding domain-containing protein [Myxococcus sp. SDU36]
MTRYRPVCRVPATQRTDRSVSSRQEENPLTASNPSPGKRHVVAVFGANGHTGRFVVAELLRRGHRVVAMGRDFARLSAAFEQTEVELRAACLEDSDALGRALVGVEVIVNCAGPFLDTAEALVAAALRARVHYLDVSAEQASAQALFERFSVAAEDAGILVLPAVGFYGGFADLLATVATAGWAEADAVSIGIALDAWWPTPGTRNTGRRNTVPRVVIEAGKLAPKGAAGPSEWHFPAPFGRQEMAEVPFSEMVLIHRHLRAMQVRTWLNTRPLDDLSNPSTPPPVATDASGRSAQRFLVEVRARRGAEERRVTASGRDIYAFTAPLVVEAVERILAGGAHAGVRSVGEAFDAADYLRSLASHFDFDPSTLAADGAIRAPAAR